MIFSLFSIKIDDTGIIQANRNFHILVLLVGIYPSRLGPMQNVIGITDISGSFRVFLLPHEHMISDPKSVSSLIIIVTFAWGCNPHCFLLYSLSYDKCLAFVCFCLLIKYKPFYMKIFLAVMLLPFIFLMCSVVWVKKTLCLSISVFCIFPRR